MAIKKLTYNNNEVIVDYAIKDSNGNNIASTYATTSQVAGKQPAFNDGNASIASTSNDIVTLKSGVTQTGGTISNSSGGDITLSKVAKTGEYTDLNNRASISISGSGSAGTGEIAVVTGVTSSGTDNHTLTLGFGNAATKTYVDSQDNDLSVRIAALEGRGRFLSSWNSTTGLPSSYPTIPEGAEYPYTYTFKTGDYYIVSAVGSSGNLRPAGTSITKQSASSSWTIGSEPETSSVSVNDNYLFDGASWTLVHSATAATTWGTIVGSLSSQTDLQNALNAKANNTDATTSASGLMSASDKTKLNGIATGATTVSVSASGTATDTVKYITVNGTEKKIGGEEYTAGNHINITNNVISANYSTATTSADGLMSSSDKTKLDGIHTGATEVSVSVSGTSTDEVRYITVNGTEKKIGGGAVNDVQINGMTILSSGTANFNTQTAYDSSTNKIATMSDMPTIDQSYSAISSHAQSGTAVASAVSVKQNILTAGTGIDIDSDTISVDTSVVQPKLTAGSNVSISESNVISATDTTYSAGSNIDITNGVISATDTTYAQGNGITISDNTISVNTSVVQEKLIQGTNISISGTTISATDTTYSAGNGLTLTGTSFSANVENNITSTSTINSLSAYQGKLLNDRINNLSNIGRFLSILDAEHGTVSSQPSGSVGDTYTYHVGDYFRVGANGYYLPKGTLTFTIDETSGSSNFEVGLVEVKIGDVIYCSNVTASSTTWVVQESSGGGTVQDVQLNGVSVLSGGIANITGVELTSNKVTSISGSSTDTQYPSAKLVYDQLATKQASLSSTQLNAVNSGITSGKVSTYDGYASSKQDLLVSGTNIKTINSTSILGSGNITVGVEMEIFESGD